MQDLTDDLDRLRGEYQALLLYWNDHLSDPEARTAMLVDSAAAGADYFAAVDRHLLPAVVLGDGRRPGRRWAVRSLTPAHAIEPPSTGW